MYDLNSKFDIAQHKERFVNYFEVIILKDGTIEYAVPSHQEKLIEIVMEQNGWTREELYDNTPVEYYADFMTWLCLQSGAISVWNSYLIAPKISRKQIVKLKRLKLEGLYKGVIPVKEC